MSAFDIVYLFCIQVAVLAGIALGFHSAYRTAEKYDRKDNEYYRTSEAVDVVHDNRTVENNNEEEPRKKSKFCKKINKKKQMSFSEFDCQFTGENHTEKLERTMAEQDEAYNYLKKRIKE